MSQIEALLKGKDHLEQVDLAAFGVEEPVKVRPITSAEAAHLDAIKYAGIEPEAAPDGQGLIAMYRDTGVLLDRLYRVREQAVAYGLSHSGETVTPEQAGQLPQAVQLKLAAVIFEISGIGDAAEGSFRPGVAVGGDGDAAAEPGGSATGAEPGGLDASATAGAARSHGTRRQ